MARENICGIYKITNNVNGKVYIGQSKNCKSRWNEHRSCYKNKNNKRIYNYKIYQAMRKYGIENFVFEVIEKCELEKLNEREVYWIEKYDSFKNGYNATTGGDGTANHEITEETRNKISKNRKYKTGSEHNGAKPVIFDGVEYGCAKDLCDKFNFNIKNIRSYLNHSNNMPVEFYVLGLRYKDENMNTYKVCTDKDNCNKETYLDGMLFKTASECAKYCGVSPKILRSWLSGARRMPKEYYDRGLRYSYKEMKDYHHQEELIVKYKSKEKTKKVIEMSIQLYCDCKLFYSKQHFADYYVLKYSTVASWFGKNGIPKYFKDLGLKQITINEAKELLKNKDINYANLQEGEVLYGRNR